jgi:hypothetical protein
MAVGTKEMFAPYISDELLLEVLSLLYVGIPVETIMQRHSEMVERQGGPSNRDDLLTHRYVRRLERKIRRSVSLKILQTRIPLCWAFRQIGSYSR